MQPKVIYSIAVLQLSSSFFYVWQVFSGGNNDVDVDLMSPSKQIIYSEQRQQYGTHSWKTDMGGEYTFCFSNKFSSVTHKMVYFDFQAGNEQPVKLSPGDITEEMTQVNFFSCKILYFLKHLEIGASSDLYSAIITMHNASVDGKTFSQKSNKVR